MILILGIEEREKNIMQKDLKHIQEFPTYYRVQYRFQESGKVKSYSVSFSFKKYGGKEEAYVEAVKARDRMYIEMQNLKQKAREGRNKFYDPYYEATTVSNLYQQSLMLFTTTKATQERHGHFYDACIGEEFGDRDLHTIKASEIQQSLNKLVDTKSDDYIGRVLSIWRRIYKVAKVRNLCVEDESGKVILPKSKVPAQPKRVALSKEVYESVLEGLKPIIRGTEKAKFEREQMRFLVEFLHATGMRVGEATALMGKDVDFQRKVIKIYKRVGSNSSSEIAIVSPKTPESVRDLPMNEEIEHLCEEIAQQSCCKKPDSLLFHRYDGSLWPTTVIATYIGRTAKSKHVEFKLYDLRHDFATRKLAEGVSPAVVRDLMGHKAFDMTLAYARSSEEDLHKAMKK